MLSRNQAFVNLTGTILALGCVVHCMLMPVCLASLPELGLSWLAGPIVHQLLALAGIGFGLLTLIPGWLQHGRHSVLLLAFCGLSIMNYSAFVAEDCCQVASPIDDAPKTIEAQCSGSCCSEPDSVEASIEIEQSLTGIRYSLSQFGSWFLGHPTVAGALLLAAAHLVNGRCGRGCCPS